MLWRDHHAQRVRIGRLRHEIGIAAPVVRRWRLGGVEHADLVGRQACRNALVNVACGYRIGHRRAWIILCHQGEGRFETTQFLEGFQKVWCPDTALVHTAETNARDRHPLEPDLVGLDFACVIVFRYAASEFEREVLGESGAVCQGKQ